MCDNVLLAMSWRGCSVPVLTPLMHLLPRGARNCCGALWLTMHFSRLRRYPFWAARPAVRLTTDVMHWSLRQRSHHPCGADVSSVCVSANLPTYCLHSWLQARARARQVARLLWWAAASFAQPGLCGLCGRSHQLLGYNALTATTPAGRHCACGTCHVCSRRCVLDNGLSTAAAKPLTCSCMYALMFQCTRLLRVTRVHWGRSPAQRCGGAVC